MVELGQTHRLPLAHLALSLLDERTLLGSEDIFGVNYALGLDEHTIVFGGECYIVSFPQLQGFENLAGNDHLAPLAHTPDGLPC